MDCTGLMNALNIAQSIDTTSIGLYLLLFSLIPSVASGLGAFKLFNDKLIAWVIGSVVEGIQLILIFFIVSAICSNV